MLNKLSVSTWLLVTIVVSPLAGLPGSSQAAIIQAEPASSQRRQAPVQDQALEKNFILLTTGEQIKLYQTRRSSLASPDSWSLTGHSFVINSTSSLIAFSKPGDSFIRLLGNNTYSRWLAQSSSFGPSKASILPGNQPDYVEFSSTKSGWRKPFIADVDYFFDDRYCSSIKRDNQPSQCMVIVWLDKSNNFLHYGSLNLTSLSMSSKGETSQHKTKVVDLIEFPPVDLLKQSELEHNNFSAQAYGFLVQRKRNWIRVALSDGKQAMANQILSGQLRNYRETFERSEGTYSYALLSTEVTAFNTDCKPSDGFNSTLKNLSVDEENNWLFYLDQSRGGKIFAIGPTQEHEGQDKTLHALVVDNTQANSNVASGVTAMTLDSEGRRLIWLTESNTIYSSDLAGEILSIIGQLSARPLIRSPSTLQLFRDTLFISDPIRRALLAYDMKAHETESDTGRPTHEVLLVDMPAVFGFRLIDITSEPVTRNELDFDQQKDIETKNERIYLEENKTKVEVQVKPIYQACSRLYESRSSIDVKTLYTYQLSFRTNPGDDCGYHPYHYLPEYIIQAELAILVLCVIVLSIIFFTRSGLPWLKRKFRRASSQADLKSSSSTSKLNKYPV